MSQFSSVARSTSEKSRFQRLIAGSISKLSEDGEAAEIFSVQYVSA